MSLSFRVGGTRGTFDEPTAREVAGVLDQAFGAEGDWEGSSPRDFGDIAPNGWALLQAKAAADLGAANLPNLLALGADGRGAYLPTSMRAVSLPLAAGGDLRCAGLPGLRRELETLADCWGIPTDDEALEAILTTHDDPDDGPVADAPEVVSFAQLALAANEAARRGCPLWLIGPRS